jgi:hypothetical protein
VAHKEVVAAFIGVNQRAFAACVKDGDPCLQTLLQHNDVRASSRSTVSDMLLGDIPVGVVGHQHGGDDADDGAEGNIAGNRVA